MLISLFAISIICILKMGDKKSLDKANKQKHQEAKERESGKNVKNNSENVELTLQAGAILAIFTVMMLSLPLATFYLITYLGGNTVVASGGAIIVVQIIIGAYVYIAWREETRDFEKEKKE